MKDKYNMTLEENLFVMKRNLVDSIWKSANLEGIAVTYPQTEIIMQGLGVQNIKIKDINAIVNLKHAWEFIEENIEYPIEINYISKINKLVGEANVTLFSGEIRVSDVSMGGTKWKPEIPNKEKISEKLSEILESENSATEKAIETMLFLMRTQLFYDGNKRTSLIVANQIMIQNGVGIISIPIEEQENFLSLLIKFYETNDMAEIKKLVYDKCIDGIDFRK